jgi:CheY-like chemotaxis protein
MQTEEKRILVVDDDDAIRMLLLTILRRRGLIVDTAKNGAEALQKLGECNYVVMLLDLMMPVVSGWEVLEKVATFEAARRPLTIVLTAGSEPRDFKPELVIGSVKKPFDVELLDDMVAACVSMVGRRQQLPGCPSPDVDQKPSDSN